MQLPKNSTPLGSSRKSNQSSVRSNSSSLYKQSQPWSTQLRKSQHDLSSTHAHEESTRADFSLSATISAPKRPSLVKPP